MIDRDGVEWLTVRDAAERLDVAAGLIYAWVARGPDVVRTHRAGRRVAVCMPDVLDLELAWRKRAKGHRRGDFVERQDR